MYPISIGEDKLFLVSVDSSVTLFSDEMLSFGSESVESGVGGQKDNQFEIWFRTQSKSGLILWTQSNRGTSVKSDYLSIAINDGFVELSYNLGKQKELFILKSNLRVDDGRWHMVHVERNRRLGVLTLDNNRSVTGNSEAGATELNTDGVLWIGGHPNLPAGLPADYYMGFVGCLKDLKVDNEYIPLATHFFSNPAVTSVAVTPLKFCHE